MKRVKSIERKADYPAFPITIFNVNNKIATFEQPYIDPKLKVVTIRY